jgi:hypothetical protein
MSRSYTLPPSASMACRGTALLFYFTVCLCVEYMVPVNDHIDVLSCSCPDCVGGGLRIHPTDFDFHLVEPLLGVEGNTAMLFRAWDKGAYRQTSVAFCPNGNLCCVVKNKTLPQRFPNCGARPPGGAVGPLRDIYFELNTGSR